MKRAIRNLIIGKDYYIESWNAYRQVLLSGQYALISLLVLIVYMFLEIFHPETSVTFGVAALLVAFSIVLHRYQQHCIANYVLFPTLNILLFLVVCSESIFTGAAFFFIPLSIGSFAVFNYRQRSVAVSFCLLSAILFSLAITNQFAFLPFRDYSQDYIQLNLIINFAVAFPISITSIYLLISISHRNARELVKANKKLTILNEELDRFVYSTSHDLRAPLMSVKGLLSLLDIAKDEDQVRYKGLMHERIDSLDKFIKDITEYSRNNRLQVTCEHVNVYNLIDEIWESLRYGADAKGIEFKNEVPTDLVVMNDGRRMKIVLGNLISNAIRYHDHWKDDKYIRLYHKAVAGSFTLHIEDNGQGIAPELQAKVFDMFFRASEQSQGSGLGLFIVKETVAKLSGRIELDSVVREGSTFSITLPICVE